MDKNTRRQTGIHQPHLKAGTQTCGGSAAKRWFGYTGNDGLFTGKRQKKTSGLCEVD